MWYSATLATKRRRRRPSAACEALGAKAVAVRCDVSDGEADVKALMDTALKTFGRIDILVNNAGITRDGLLMTDEGGGL